MIAFVISYNRLTLLKNMVDYLGNISGVYPIILDNNSAYEPLLRYIHYEAPCRVVHMDKNYGSHVVWDTDVLDRFVPTGDRYIVTDPDLDMAGVPDDWLGELEEGLDRHPSIPKAGIALKIDDLPDTDVARQAKEWEAPHWAYPLDSDRGMYARFYKASTLTTLCVCRTRDRKLNSVRTSYPYIARHIPWYYTSASELPEDEIYYMRTVHPEKWNYWTVRLRKELGVCS